MTLLPDGSPEVLRGCAPLGSIALVRSLEVVEVDEGSKRVLELLPPSEYDLPMSVKNCPLCRAPM